MAQKQSIFGRIQQLTRANVNAMLDRAEDPQKMMDQLIRDYTNNIAAAEKAIAETIGNLRMAEADLQEDIKARDEWGGKAEEAIQAAQNAAANGNTADADRFQQMARIALQKQVDAETSIANEEPMVNAQRQQVEQLKNGLTQMKNKLGEVKSRRDSLKARAKTAQAMAQVSQAASKINILDPTSELGRFEELIRRQEANAKGQMEIANMALQSQQSEWDQLAASTGNIEVEARPAALMNGGSPAALPAAGPSANDWGSTLSNVE